MASEEQQPATAKIIDGKAIAQAIRNEIAAEVRSLSETYGKVKARSRSVWFLVGDPEIARWWFRLGALIVGGASCFTRRRWGWQAPGLAVVIVGSRKDSQSYVATKRKACAEVGIQSFDVDLPEDVSEADVIQKVHDLNSNPDVHGESKTFPSSRSFSWIPSWRRKSSTNTCFIWIPGWFHTCHISMKVGDLGSKPGRDSFVSRLREEAKELLLKKESSSRTVPQDSDWKRTDMDLKSSHSIANSTRRALKLNVARVNISGCSWKTSFRFSQRVDLWRMQMNIWMDPQLQRKKKVSSSVGHRHSKA